MDFTGFLKTLGATIRVHRKAANLTQEHLAETLGVSTQWVSELERGNGAPSLELLVKIAETLGTSITSLTQPAAEAGDQREQVAELLVWMQRLPPDVVAAVSSLAAAMDKALSEKGA